MIAVIIAWTYSKYICAINDEGYNAIFTVKSSQVMACGFGSIVSGDEQAYCGFADGSAQTGG